MPSAEKDAKPLAIRQRKPHRKSRLGCGNCKLRSVKCDEAKPTCKRCASSGFECSYSRSAPSLQLARAAGGAATMKLTLDVPVPTPNRGLPPPAPGLRIPVAGPVVDGPEGSYELTPSDFATLDRFRTRSLQTFGAASARSAYQDGAFHLGSTDPFLLHIFLAFALLHDTFLSPTTLAPAHRASLAFHWYHGTALFHRNLSVAMRTAQSKLPGTHRDALWTSAALLGSAAFAFVGVSDPRMAWPLKDLEPTDLDWLKMSDGKRVVWELTDPTRPGSIYRPVTLDPVHMAVPQGIAPIQPGALPELFYPLLGLDTNPEPRDNPYHIAASIIAQLLPFELDENNVVHFLAFISQLDTRYRHLLEEKDPKAMVLLAWWYVKISNFKRWWLSQRAWIEGKAVCIYMDREHKDDAVLMELMEYPKSVFMQEPQQQPGSAKGSGSQLISNVRMQDRLMAHGYPRIEFKI